MYQYLLELNTQIEDMRSVLAGKIEEEDSDETANILDSIRHLLGDALLEVMALQSHMLVQKMLAEGKRR